MVLTGTHNLCFEQKYENYLNFSSESFHFLMVKFSVYLNRYVFEKWSYEKCSLLHTFALFSMKCINLYFQNFLNNLKDTNVMAFVARIGLFFQMLCVFPLLVFIMRLQFMNSIFGTTWPG